MNENAVKRVQTCLYCYQNALNICYQTQLPEVCQIYIFHILARKMKNLFSIKFDYLNLSSLQSGMGVNANELQI